MASGLSAADTPEHRSSSALVTGHNVENVFPAHDPIPVDAPVVLGVDDLALEGAFADVSFTVRAGEVVGLAASSVRAGRRSWRPPTVRARPRAAP